MYIPPESSDKASNKMEIKTKENCSEVINKGQGEKKKSIKGGTNGGLTGASPVPLQQRSPKQLLHFEFVFTYIIFKFFLKKRKDDLQCRVKCQVYATRNQVHIYVKVYIPSFSDSFPLQVNRKY